MFFDLHCDSLSANRDPLRLYASRECRVLSLFADDQPSGYASFLSLTEQYERFCALLKRDPLTFVKSTEDCASFSRGAILSIEGCNGLLGSPKLLSAWQKRGVRVFSLCWRENALCSGWNSANDRGLSALGVEFSKEAERLGLIADISHLSPKSAMDLLENYPHGVIATHSALLEREPHPRNLPPEHMRALCKRKGLIGIPLHAPFLGGKTFEEGVYRQVDVALQRYGSECIAVGTDADGTHEYPAGLAEERPHLPQICSLLRAKYGESTARAITGENALRFFKTHLPKAEKSD